MRMMKQFLLESAFIKNFSTRMHLPQGLTSTCFLKNCDLTKVFGDANAQFFVVVCISRHLDFDDTTSAVKKRKTQLMCMKRKMCT